MNRLTILKTLNRKKNLKNYLEIGVLNGHIFFRIQSRFKIAIDPEFVFGNSRKIGKVLLNPYNLYNRYFPVKSDDFFERDAPRLLKDKKIELALIDGMHDYEYALRDVENTLNYSDDNVVIIMHDCNPASREASVSFAEHDARNRKCVWNGDVWKVILHLRSLRSDVCAFVWGLKPNAQKQGCIKSAEIAQNQYVARKLQLCQIKRDVAIAEIS